jgi:hypothetical protein
MPNLGSSCGGYKSSFRILTPAEWLGDHRKAEGVTSMASLGGKREHKVLEMQGAGAGQPPAHFEFAANS